VVEVAMFSRANGLVEMFNRLVMRSVALVAMPYFAQSDREGGSVAAAYARTVSYLTAVGWTFFAFLGVAAFSAIRIMYGPQWDMAVPLAQILCLAGALDVVHSMARDALLVRGRAKEGHTLQLILVALQVCGLLLVLPFGLPGAAWGMAAAAAVGLIVTQLYLARYLGLRAVDLLKACLPSLYLCAIAVAPAATWAAFVGVTPENFVVFGVGSGALTVVCWLLGVYLLRHPLLEELAPIKQRFAALWRTP